jgi:hypothetical protein
MPRIEIRTVQSRADLKAFVELPWSLYKDDQYWVPPIKPEQIRTLTPGRHPFWEFSRRELFMAWRGATPVGRIAGIIDERNNRVHGEQMGAWGFFECVDDVETASALYRAAEQWVAREGATFSRGPLNPSFNYEVGTLIDGFDSMPTMMMTYNPRYYADLAEHCGYRKEKDLYSYVAGCDMAMPAWAIDLAQRIAERGEYTVVPITRKTIEGQLEVLREVYNECWSQNWGFVPMADGELGEMAKLLKYILDPDLAFFVYHGDNPIAVSILLPDVNPIVKSAGGTLGVRALYQFFANRSKVAGLRGLIFGVKPAYRKVGTPLFVLHRLRGALQQKPQYRWVELGWDLEDNDAINSLYEEGGLRPAKKWRIYRKELQG